MISKLRVIDNIIVETGHKVLASIIKKIISDMCNEYGNIKYCNVILDDIIVLLDSKFNLISVLVILHKG